MFLRKNKKEGIAKAKRQPQVDDAASTASQESVVSPPVVILPLDQQLVDSNLGLENIQEFQHVDNIVELQFQPVSSPPPPLPPLFLLTLPLLKKLIV